MIDAVLVKFDLFFDKRYYAPGEWGVKKGDYVVVVIDENEYLGVCESDVVKVSKKNIDGRLETIRRKATDADLSQAKENKKVLTKAIKEAKKEAQKLDLNMNIVQVDYSLDRKQMFFFFLADSRVDFRELAKKLAARYRTRIELRQIGIRDKAKQFGGLGPCGLSLCCNTFLTDFSSVSINMAKNQFLALNPSKINGLCNRLLCCLNYEDETYSYLKKDLPKIGMKMKTDQGEGKVVSIDVFKKAYKLELENGDILERTV